MTMPYRISRGEFEILVERALKTVPRKFKKYFGNISVIVEDRPSDDDAEAVDVPPDELLGLFRGIDFGSKGGLFDVPSPLPDAIVLYQKNLEDICSSEGELIEEIRMTVVHEIGHYFGMSEEELERYE
jgi:predicted Zn-dependent protease with MMP-like domain